MFRLTGTLLALPNCKAENGNWKAMICHIVSKAIDHENRAEVLNGISVRHTVATYLVARDEHG
jgi:hypothetical protein